MSYILERNVGGASGSSDQEQDKVPDNWVLKKLGGILNIERGSVITKSACSPGQVPVVAGGKTPAYYHNLANRKGPTITISASGANAGYISYYEMPIFASDCSTISEGVNYDLRFVYFFLLSRQSELYAAQKGGAQPHVNPRDVQVLSFMQPSLLEQTAIANILSDQETLVAHYNDLIALHEKRFAYLSDELLSGRLRLNVDGIASSNENWQMVSVNGELVEIPADWETKKLGQTLTCLDSKRKPLNSKERASQKGLVPYWGANSIVDFVSGHLLDEDVVLLGEDAAPFFDKSKRVAFASHGKIWPNNHVHVLKPKDIDFSYAVYVLNQLPYEQIIGVTVRPKLTQSRMLDIDLVMPSRLEQALIANVLSDQEALIAEYKKLRDAEKKRFDWLSDALLSGTYRVKMEA